MNIGARYKAFHEQAQIKLLRQLAGLDEVTGSQESETGREYEEGERATALWEQFEREIEK